MIFRSLVLVFLAAGIAFSASGIASTDKNWLVIKVNVANSYEIKVRTQPC